MNKDFSTLFIEIHDSQFIFYVSKIDEKNDFKIFSELKDVPFKPDVFESFLGGNAKKLFNL